MKEITLKVYEYKDLTENAQSKALDELKEQYEYYFDIKDSLQEYYLEQLELHNLVEDRDNNLLYSLSHSQGDGVCFEGVYSWRYKDEDYSIKVEHNGRYYHKRSVTICIEDSNGEDVTELIYMAFREKYHSICDDIERFGYQLIEDSESKESIEELCSDAEVVFNKYGYIIDIEVDE
jgi:hypothetical protein